MLVSIVLLYITFRCDFPMWCSVLVIIEIALGIMSVLYEMENEQEKEQEKKKVIKYLKKQHEEEIRGDDDGK